MNHAMRRDDYNNDAYDQLLSAELILSNEAANGYIRGTVIKRKKNNIEQAIWTSHSYPIFDTRMYIVKMYDGAERELQHNIIATNIFTQADSKGKQFMILDEISDYRRLENAIEIQDGFNIGHNGN